MILACTLAAAACGPAQNSASRFSVSGTQILQDGEPYYFIGTNAWYLADIALSDPQRLQTELDSLKALGLENVRVCATEQNFGGFDILLPEMERRGMSAVLFLNNAWEWSPSGYRSYMMDSGSGYQPLPSVDGYWPYMCAMADFAGNDAAVALFHEHVKSMVSRYAESKAVFAWQICNEPRPFSTDSTKVDAFVTYIHKTAALIRSLDPNHLICTGNEGAMGCNDGDYELCRRLNDCPDIDYVTVHIWPFNWSWISEAEQSGKPELVAEKTMDYIRKHLQMASELGKPVTIEEFGHPRDGSDWRNTASVSGRDSYYRLIFDEVLRSAREGGNLAGCNFWAWSGTARQTHETWQQGDDLCGDPSQEAQGLNGVYLSDSTTVSLIRDCTRELGNIINQQ